MIVKRGDTVPLTLTVGLNLTGATVRVLARRHGTVSTLAAQITDAVAGVLVHNLTGTLAVGNYDVEVEITRDGVVQTAPTNGYVRLSVVPDLG